jgi:uncharacterized phiE125 gp8 family phage protein
MNVVIEDGPLAVPLAELKSYLRITRAEEDVLLDDLIRAATSAAERSIGALIIRRAVEETVSVRSGWMRLSEGPVAAITTIEGLPADGPTFVLPIDAYALDIGTDGRGIVRIDRPGAAGRVRVSYEAGLAVDVEAVPAAISHAIVRLAGEYHAKREGLEAQPPASVIALLQPWRRMRLA